MLETGTKTEGSLVTVDCALCHDPNYNFSARTFNAAEGRWDFSAADSGARVWNIASDHLKLTDICYQCHISGFEAKRGTPLRPDAYGNQDVHYERNNFQCLSCHKMNEQKINGDCSKCHSRIWHQIARGNGHVDEADATDMLGTPVECVDCHNYSRHPDIDGRKGPWTVDAHVRLACQVCHTPQQKNNIVYRRFRSADVNDIYSLWETDLEPFEQRLITDTETGHTYTVTPYQLKWFADEWTSPTEPDVYNRMKPIYTDRSNPDARLVAVKQLKAIHYPNKEIIGWFQMSHGTQVKELARNNCDFCHLTIASELGVDPVP